MVPNAKRVASTACSLVLTVKVASALLLAKAVLPKRLKSALGSGRLDAVIRAVFVTSPSHPSPIAATISSVNAPVAAE